MCNGAHGSTGSKVAMKGGVRPLEDVIQRSGDLRGPATLRCLDVSHVTLRKFLTALVDEGVLRSAHGRGAASRVDQAVHRDSQNEGGRWREGKDLPPISKRLVGPDERHVCRVAPRSGTRLCADQRARGYRYRATRAGGWRAIRPARWSPPSSLGSEAVLSRPHARSL
jgi:hypothetical protein